MPDSRADDNRLTVGENPNRARDHLANQRTFLAWVRTGIAIVVLGFAIGRFVIAIRQFMQIQGRESRTAGLSVWFGMIAIVAGVVLTLAGLLRYRVSSWNPEPSSRLVLWSTSWVASWR
ncbi:MAG TPA: DUF202 domain-containing protein [Terriglobia bacterium]|nr:DUF202 domain-containing protein [Terriglobia bacterium]